MLASAATCSSADHTTAATAGTIAAKSSSITVAKATVSDAVRDVRRIVAFALDFSMALHLRSRVANIEGILQGSGILRGIGYDVKEE